MRIGGRASYIPPLLAQLQVDGSYKQGHGRVAIKMIHATHSNISQITKNLYSVESSTETEWASVYYGIQFALEKNESAMTVENDCLGVIYHLYPWNTLPRKEYARYYRYKIYELADQADWVAVRWIPRAHNNADRLFRV